MDIYVGISNGKEKVRLRSRPTFIREVVIERHCSPERDEYRKEEQRQVSTHNGGERGAAQEYSCVVHGDDRAAVESLLTDFIGTGVGSL
jgi:hypothetical protein